MNAAAFLHPRDEILHAMERIYRYRMTTTSGGNLSPNDQAHQKYRQEYNTRPALKLIRPLGP